MTPFAPIEIFSPRRDAGSGTNPLNEFVVRSIAPSGFFAVGQDFDDIVVTPIDFTCERLTESACKCIIIRDKL